MKQEIANRFKKNRCCVLIPTYNNAQTLDDVILSVKKYTADIVVVNDGSTDRTLDILQQHPDVHLHSYPNNKGKGMALREGFRFAREKGYDYAITIDSDGQHYAEDLPTFLDKLETEPGSLIVGARNMDQEAVPGKSSFGNKFSNFWYRLETGIDLPDTQSGYRLYPIKSLENFRFFTRKYEFEIEVLVRAAWADIPVSYVPVKVYYPPADERITHFRPLKDFTRISILNTVLVFITFLYIKPRNFLRWIKKKSFRGLIRQHLLNPEESNRRKTLSVMYGIFMGIVPIWGYQLIVAIPTAHFMKLNKAIVVLAAHISIPPMIPILIFLSYKMGGWVLPEEAVPLHLSDEINLETIKENVKQYVIGAMLLATVAALAIGILTHILLTFFYPQKTTS